MKKNQDLVFAGAMLVSGIILFFLIMARSVPAAGKLGEGYRFLHEADLSEEVSGTVYYDDGFYGVIGYGISNAPEHPDREAAMAGFLESSLRSVKDRVLACGMLYTMIVSAFFAYFLYLLYGEDRPKHTAAVLVSCILVFLLYTGILALLFRQNGIPGGLPPGRTLMLSAVCLVSLCGGACALGLLVRITRFRKAAALAAVPAIFVLFMFSFLAEAGLYSEKYADSFAHVSEADPRLLDESFNGAYYDEDKNVLVVEGKEYDPEQVENPEYLTGGRRLGAYVLEVLDPYSGHSLLMAEQAAGMTVKPGVPALYALKGVLWILAALCVPGRPERSAA